MYLGPLVFKEIFKAKPWGGRALARVAGKKLPPGEPIGESWELADHPHGTSVVGAGPLAGRTLRNFMQHNRMELLGQRSGNGRFPLLIKVIDARKQLSVQVHPDDGLARAMGLKDSGKTEAWVVLEARRGGRIISGLKSQRDIPRLAELARTGGLTDRLRVLHPREGDALLCRAWTVHASGPGIVFLEVQQNSDATFRLYDWGRMGLDGKPRALHLNEAVRAVGDRAATVVRQKPRRLKAMPFPATRLVTCTKFVIDRWRVRRRVTRKKPPRFEILHVISGTGILEDSAWPSQKLTRGRTVLIPACVRGYGIAPTRPLVLIRAAEPE